jgi:hypothetical protein
VHGGGSTTNQIQIKGEDPIRDVSKAGEYVRKSGTWRCVSKGESYRKDEKFDE